MMFPGDGPLEMPLQKITQGSQDLLPATSLDVLDSGWFPADAEVKDSSAQLHTLDHPADTVIAATQAWRVLRRMTCGSTSSRAC